MNPSRSSLPWLRIAFMISDIAVVNLAVIAGFFVRFLGPPPAYNWHAYESVAPWLSVAVVILLAAYDSYQLNWTSAQQLARSIFPVVVLLAGLTVVTSFLLGRFGFPRSVFVLSTVLDWPLLYWSRRLWQHLLYHRMETKILILSNRPTVSVPNDLHTVGPNPRVRMIQATDFRPGLDADVFMLDDTLSEETKLLVLNDALLRKIRCLWQPSLYDTLVAQSTLMVVGQTPYLAVDTLPSPWVRRLGKRAADAVIAGILLVVSLPLTLCIALAITLDDGRPVIFRQERITAGNQSFTMLKFRTLVRDYEDQHGRRLTMPTDSGVTRVGRILRISHLDEIPQLWNVVRGEMSLVGPRPERPHYVDEFSQELPTYNLRHQIKPGITGLAQLSGHYLSSPQEKLQMDLTYSRHSNLWMDLKIMLQTLEHVWRRAPVAQDQPVLPSAEEDESPAPPHIKRPG